MSGSGGHLSHPARVQEKQPNRHFSIVELNPSTDGSWYARPGLCRQRRYELRRRDQVSPRDYPNEMRVGKLMRRHPVCAASISGREEKNIDFYIPRLGNPGTHTLSFVIWRAGEWLNKYEVWRNNGGNWPGAQSKH